MVVKYWPAENTDSGRRRRHLLSSIERRFESGFCARHFKVAIRANDVFFGVTKTVKISMDSRRNQVQPEEMNR